MLIFRSKKKCTKLTPGFWGVTVQGRRMSEIGDCPRSKTVQGQRMSTIGDYPPSETV